jgi:hypothetical protein
LPIWDSIIASNDALLCNAIPTASECVHDDGLVIKSFADGIAIAAWADNRLASLLVVL